MKMFRLKKRYITLIEIMIVMFLIALITGVLAYNFQGSLDEGKKFKTETAMNKLHTILNLEIAKDPALLEDIDSQWEGLVTRSPLVQNSKDLIYDGWGKKYHVEKNSEGNIEIRSEGLEEYLKKKIER